MGWEVGGRFKSKRTYVYLWLIHVDVWQKSTQHWKAIILQLKIKLSFSKQEACRWKLIPTFLKNSTIIKPRMAKTAFFKINNGGGLVTKSCLTLATPWTVVCRLLCLWDSPGKNTGVSCYFLLQGIFPTQKSNPGLLHHRQMLYQLSYRGSKARRLDLPCRQNT